MKKKNVLWGCLALVAVLAIVIGIVLVLGNKEKEDDASTSTAAVSEEETTGADESGTAGESESAGETIAAEEPDFSAGLTDDGFFEGITATDYVTLYDYKGMKVAAADIEVTDEEFDAYVAQNIMANFTETVEVTDRAVKSGDTVNIDYVGSVDGVEFEGGSYKGYSLVIGSGKFIPGFEDQIIGHEAGEEFDVIVTFPDPYKNSPDLAGKEAVFKVTLNSISASVTPEIDDAFVEKNFPKYASAEEFLREIRTGYEKTEKINYVWNYVLENSTVSEIPEKLIENYIEQQVKMYKSMAASYQMTYEDLLSMYGTTPEEFVEMEREYAESDLTQMLISQAVCETEKIQLEEGDDAKYFGYEEEAMKEIYDYYGKGYVNQILRMQKASEFVGESCVVE